MRRKKIARNTLARKRPISWREESSKALHHKNIFITGGAGFISSALIAHLVEDNTVIIYDDFHRNPSSSSPFASHRNVRIIRGDVLDYDLLRSSMKDAHVIIHAAAIAGIDTILSDPVRAVRVNVLGTANVLQAAHENGQDYERIIYFSSWEVFGPTAFRSTEHDQTVAGSAGEARWTYAISKLSGEHLAKVYDAQYRLPVVTVRPFNVYGPGQADKGAMHTFIKRALKNQDLEIHGDGNQIRAWCYIDDVIDGILRCLHYRKAIGESFNIGNPRAIITILGLAQTVCRILNSRSKIIFRSPISADVELRMPGIKKAEKFLGFRAAVDLEEGILKTAEWYSRLPQRE